MHGNKKGPFVTEKQLDMQLFFIKQEINGLKHKYEAVLMHCHRLEEILRQALSSK